MKSEIKNLSKEGKIKLMKAISQGSITKNDLQGENLGIIINLLGNGMEIDTVNLTCVKMGETVSCSFKGKRISLKEYENIARLYKALGGIIIPVIANFNAPPLASKEEDVDLG